MGVEKHEIVVGYKVGDRVRSPRARWSPSWAPWKSSNLERSKVSVMVSMFGRETPVELELDQVEQD